jgi:hypothetical protein
MADKRTVRALSAGLVAWLLMTIWIYTGRYVGLPKTDFGKLVGGAVTVTKPNMVHWMSADWWYGMGIHFILGTIIFALIYAFVVQPLIPHRPIVAGLFWGLLLWVTFETLVMYLLGIQFRGMEIFAPVMAPHRFM